MLIWIILNKAFNHGYNLLSTLHFYIIFVMENLSPKGDE